MAYKFRADEPVRGAIIQCGREQLDRAITALSERIKGDPVSAVHDARKAIKQERSLLRLARSAMPSEERRRENAALREVARGLSNARDSAVLVTTLDQLSDRFAGQPPATTFDAVREHLKARHGGATGLIGAADAAEAAEELRDIRRRVDDWELAADGWHSIDAGLLRSYERGRKAFASARTTRSPEDLHAWRKRVKDLWHHDRLLAPSCGPAVRGQAKDAHRLSDLLGDDHDLVLLRDELTQDVVPVPVDVDALVRLIDHRRAELQTEAIRIGERVHAERPKAFRRRMRRSWNAGRTAALAPLEQHPAELAAATREPQPS